MSKIKCGKCGEIFMSGAGEIQICPVCGCKMRVATSNPNKYDTAKDDYDSIKEEYARMMREKATKPPPTENIKQGASFDNGVYLTPEEYKALLAQQQAAADRARQAQNDPYGEFESASRPAYEQPPQQPMYPQVMGGGYGQPMYPQVMGGGYGQPMYPQVMGGEQSYMPDLYARANPPMQRSETYEMKSSTPLNIISLILLVLVGAYCALSMLFDRGDGVTGMTIMFSEWNGMPLNLIMVIVYFMPAVLAIAYIAFIKFKTPKFIIMILFQLMVIVFLFYNTIYNATLSIEAGSEIIFRNEDITELVVWDWLAVGATAFATLMCALSGVFTKHLRLVEDIEEQDLFANIPV